MITLLILDKSSSSSSSSLVLCRLAGPWSPTSPVISILCPPFHIYIRTTLQIINHSHSRPSTMKLPLHPPLNYIPQQPTTSQNMTHPTRLPSQIILNQATLFPTAFNTVSFVM